MRFASIATSFALLICSAALGQGEIVVRVVTARQFDLATGAPLTNVSADPITIDPAAGPFSVELYVQALIVNAPDATGLTVIGGELRDDHSGTFEPALLTNTEALGFEVPGTDFLARTGLFPSFRTTIGSDNADPANGMYDQLIDAWTFLPLNIDELGNGLCVNDEWCDLYRFRWTTDDLSDRTITIAASSEFGGYQTLENGLEQPVPVSSEPLTIVFAADQPAPFNILEPVAGTYVTTRAPTISWEASTNADGYIVTVDDDPAFGSPDFFRAGLTTTSVDLPVSPAEIPAGIVHVRVEAINAFGSTPSLSDFAVVIPNTCRGEFTGDSPPNVDVVDLLEYLDAWFDAVRNGACD